MTYTHQDKLRDIKKRDETIIKIIHSGLPMGKTIAELYRLYSNEAKVNNKYYLRRESFYRVFNRHRLECDNEYCDLYDSPEYWQQFELGEKPRA